MNKKRLQAYKAGLLAEMLAAAYLMLKGYKILAQRYKSPFGEIDLVARKGKVLVAVEVKFRKNGKGDFGHVLETVHAKNRIRVERAFLHFIAHRPDLAVLEMRFDVICFSPPFLFRHLDNAWQARS